MAIFEVIGKLKTIKSTDSFSAYEEKAFDSGWKNVRYRFNVISDDGNRTLVEINGGKWIDDSKNVIYTRSRGSKDKKPENITVAWEDRHNADVINGIDGNRIYTCCLATFEEKDNMSKEDFNSVNHQFIERTEFAAFVKDMIESGQYKDTKFKIKGTVDFQYNESRDMFYRTLTVNKIYKVEDDMPCKAEMVVNTFYTADAMSEDMNGKRIFNCYTDYYFSNIKKVGFVPMPLVLRQRDDEDIKRVYGFVKKLTTFDDEAEVRKVTLVCSMIDGAEKKQITYDDLSDETKELIDLGMLDEKEAIRELGGSMFGDVIQETRIENYSRSSLKGSEATTYTVENLQERPVKVEEVIDLFADDDEI